MERMIEHIRKKMGKKTYVTSLPAQGCFVVPEGRMDLKKVELDPNIIVEHGKDPNTINLSEKGKEPFAAIVSTKRYDAIILYECDVNAKGIRRFIDLI